MAVEHFVEGNGRLAAAGFAKGGGGYPVGGKLQWGADE